MILEICLVLLTIYALSLFLKPTGNLPPGPRGFPLLGSLPFSFLKDCLEAKKKYGNIFMVRTGVVNFLFICDYKLSKEALSKVEFADRPAWNAIPVFEGERKLGRAEGILFSNGIHWFHTRRFLLRHLRDLGMGKSKIEGLIMREVEDLVEDFKGLTKEPSKLPFSINIAALNVIWQLMASHRYDFRDKVVEDFMGKINELQDGFMYLIILDFFPVLEYIIPEKLLSYLVGKKKAYNMSHGFEVHMQHFIDDHLKTLDPNNPRDFMDEYLIEIKEKKSEELSHFRISDLIRTTLDLFFSGSDTTAHMTKWVLTYMAKYQEIQVKIQEEIDKVVPRDVLPGLQHRNQLAYLDATINEVQRRASLISLGVFRCTAKDVKLDGYDIPKGTVVMSVAGISHKDPAYFKDPDKFDPSRFLDENGKYIPTCEGFQAFGIGKRQCLGEQFARMELFLITASLLQNFTFGPPEGEAISLEAEHFPNVQHPLKEQKLSIKFRK